MRIPIHYNEQTGFPLDSGCEVSDSCLECPLPQCKYDDPLWYRDWRRRQRDTKITAKMKQVQQQLPIEKASALVAEEFSTSIRTIYRIRKRQPITK